MLAVPILLTIAALGDSVTVAPRPVAPAAAPRAGKKNARKKKAAAKPKPYPGYVEILGQQLGEPVVNAGVGGNTTTQMLARMDADVIARHPRVVLIMAGLNDAAYVDPGPVARTEPRVPMAEFEKNLTGIVARVRKAGATPVLLTANPMTRAYRYQNLGFYQENDMNDGLVPFVDVTRRVARESKTCLADIYADWTTRRDLRTLIPDGIHPNAEGHRLIAAKVLEACGAAVRSKTEKQPTPKD